MTKVTPFFWRDGFAVCIRCVMRVFFMEERIERGLGGKLALWVFYAFCGNDSNLLIVFYVQIMPDDFVMQLHRF